MHAVIPLAAGAAGAAATRSPPPGHEVHMTAFGDDAERDTSDAYDASVDQQEVGQNDRVVVFTDQPTYVLESDV